MNHVENTRRIFLVRALNLKSAILRQIALKSASRVSNQRTYVTVKQPNNLSGSTDPDVIEVISLSHYRVSENDRESLALVPISRYF